MPASHAPVRLRWWAFALAIGFTLLGLHLAGAVYVLGPDFGSDGGWLGVFPYPDNLLVALLWAGFAAPPFWTLTGLALALGGWGWGGVRLGGMGGRLAGAILIPALALAPLLPLLGLLGEGGHWQGASDFPLAPGWHNAVGWAWLAPVLGVAAAAGLSPVGRRRRDLALYAGAVLATAMAATWSLSTLLTTFATGLPPGLPNVGSAPALFLVALLPLAVLAALAPRRRRVWALLALAGGLPLAAAAGAIPALVPGVATVAADHDWDPAADPPDFPEVRLWFATVGSVSPGKMDDAYLA
ncbi:hypothetical protein IIA16_03665, partial [bacterium]|nr:hypothetical protein [bacterium]